MIVRQYVSTIVREYDSTMAPNTATIVKLIFKLSYAHSQYVQLVYQLLFINTNVISNYNKHAGNS